MPAGALVPLAFFGLYLPSARALEAADENAEILVAAADGAPLSVAAESGGKLFAVGYAEYISDATKAANTASFVTNLYFTESALDWLLAKGG